MDYSDPVLAVCDDCTGRSQAPVLAEAAYILSQPGVLVGGVYLNSRLLERAQEQVSFFVVHFEEGDVAVGAVGGHLHCLLPLALENHEVSSFVEVLQQL
jgi:hypothetical protein